MSIITISRGSFSRGKEVAEKLAEKLGYECVSREILLEASEEFNIPEIRLKSAMHDSASVLERFSHGKLRYISYYKYALLNHVVNNNIVYHGLAGQYILKDIPHVFKIRVQADFEDRIEQVMKHDHVSRNKAISIIKKDDKERRKWSLQLYGIDTKDSSLYDLVINIHKITVDDAVNLISSVVDTPAFQATPESQRKIEDLTLAAKIHALLIDYSLMVEVKVENKTACLSNIGEVLKYDEVIRSRIEKIILAIDGIEQVKFLDEITEKYDHVNPFYNIGR
ncbi:cytidylate kinase-like family protein [Desulfogranum japonicum]|uniref:cytidylate kinase-like family protein n=1 Tax=Desulfogranum japonicum TaxID=231447 RepID=UPI00040D18E6|nr:cytidylate kinase-like family protein [Desulfogranum japonicum]